MRDETNAQNETNEIENAASDVPTAEQHDEVAGAGGEELGPGREVLLPKPYPPWPGSN